MINVRIPYNEHSGGQSAIESDDLCTIQLMERIKAGGIHGVLDSLCENISKVLNNGVESGRLKVSWVSVKSESNPDKAYGRFRLIQVCQEALDDTSPRQVIDAKGNITEQ